MNNESVETVVRLLVKAFELLLKAEARRLSCLEPRDVYDEESPDAILAAELLAMAKDLRRTLDEAK